MKLLLITIVAYLTGSTLFAHVPGLMTYQGRVTVNGTGFTGTGQFKFAIIDASGGTSYWSNDGTSTSGSQPAAAISLPVSNGVYSLLLGDVALTNMTALPASVFTNADVRLRVWFNDGVNGWSLLSPDQRLSAVGYSFMAANVADGAVTSAKLASGLTLGGTATLTGSLDLPVSSGPSEGTILQDAAPLLHTYGTDNLFLGGDAGNFTTSGSGNTGIGAQSLKNSTSGRYNTALGTSALLSTTSGEANTALGHQSLNLNITGSHNTAAGLYALKDNTASFNSAFGSGSLQNNTTGTSNAAFGEGALYANTNGNSLSAFGRGTLYLNTTGTSNTAVGNLALYSNTTGNNNVAIGANALVANTTASGVTAIGVDALKSHTIGQYNTAVGYAALSSNVAGVSNTAVGFEALFRNTAGYNTAIGDRALRECTTGERNIVIGYDAGSNMTTANHCIVIGYEAGSSMTTASNCIVIGNAGRQSGYGDIRIGTNEMHTRTYIAGISDSNVGDLRVYVNSLGQLGTQSSSRRFKHQIVDMGTSSEVILAMRPVSFRYKVDLDAEQLPQYGLIAEEVAELDPLLVVRNEDGDIQSVRYEQVNAMLLNEFLKSHRQAEARDAEVEAMKKQLQEMDARDAAQSQRERELEERLKKLEEALSRRSSAETNL